jgi:GT2 family glycosyltransferase
MEWDGPPGPAESCGGDSLMRVEAFRQAGGFLPSLIAGEEPDLCHRLRRGGWAVLRLPCEMTLHDAAMTSLGQWWRRNLRSGHASAEAWARRGGEDRRLLKPVLSDLLWALPVAWPAWPLLWWRVWRRRGALYATHIVAGKLPHCAGHWTYWWNKARSNRHQLIEYK